MKARNTKTGEVVDNFGFSKEYGTVSYTDKNGILTVSTAASGEWEIIDDQEGSVDWRAFRREAAKDILVGLCANNNLGFYGDSNTALAASAITLADELIKQLTEEEQV